MEFESRPIQKSHFKKKSSIYIPSSPLLGKILSKTSLVFHIFLKFEPILTQIWWNIAKSTQSCTKFYILQGKGPCIYEEADFVISILAAHPYKVFCTEYPLPPLDLELLHFEVLQIWKHGITVDLQLIWFPCIPTSFYISFQDPQNTCNTIGFCSGLLRPRVSHKRFLFFLTPIFKASNRS